MNDARWGKCKCGATFKYVTLPMPPSCGSVDCRFRYGPWGIGKTTRLNGATSIEWEARARMAVVRQSAGVALNPLDLEAIERCPEPRSFFRQSFDLAQADT